MEKSEVGSSAIFRTKMESWKMRANSEVKAGSQKRKLIHLASAAQLVAKRTKLEICNLNIFFVDLSPFGREWFN